MGLKTDEMMDSMHGKRKLPALLMMLDDGKKKTYMSYVSYNVSPDITYAWINNGSRVSTC